MITFFKLHITDQVTLKENECFNFDYSQTIRTKTGIGKPGPVQEARVRNSTNNSPDAVCIVEWKHNKYKLYQQSHLGYQVNKRCFILVLKITPEFFFNIKSYLYF